MAPKTRPTDPEPPLVGVVYHGAVDRRYIDPSNGCEYLFFPEEKTLVPPDLARVLRESVPSDYSLQEA